jgi:hypothetical protein
MKTEVICGNCNKINIKRKKTNFYGIPTYECINDCKYHKLDEPGCKEHKFAKTGWHRTGFWIITAVKDVLGKSNDDKVISLLFNLLFDYRTGNSENKDVILDDYDISGKLVAESIYRISNSIEIADHVYNTYFCEIAKCIENNETDKALQEFFSMVEDWKNTFGIRTETDLKKEGENITMGNNNELLRINSILNINESEDFNILFDYIKNSTDEVKLLYVEVCDALKNILVDKTDEEKAIILNSYYNSFIKVAIKDAKSKHSDHSSIKSVLGTMLLKINSTCDHLPKRNTSFQRIIKASNR